MAINPLPPFINPHITRSSKKRWGVPTGGDGEGARDVGVAVELLTEVGAALEDPRVEAVGARRGRGSPRNLRDENGWFSRANLKWGKRECGPLFAACQQDRDYLLLLYNLGETQHDDHIHNRRCSRGEWPCPAHVLRHDQSDKKFE